MSLNDFCEYPTKNKGGDNTTWLAATSYHYQHINPIEKNKNAKKEPPAIFKRLFLIFSLIIMLMKDNFMTPNIATLNPQSKLKRRFNGYFEKRPQVKSTGKFLLWDPR